MIEGRESKCIPPRRSPALLRVALSLGTFFINSQKMLKKIPAQVLPYAIERKTELAAACDVLYCKTTETDPKAKTRYAKISDDIGNWYPLCT